MDITFRKATLDDQDLIFRWLDKDHVKEFWDNSPEHREDILNFMNGRKTPSTYCDGVFTYWLGLHEGSPFSLIMTSDLALSPNAYEQALLSKTGKTFSLDFMIGSIAHFGKSLAAPTLQAFMQYIHQEVDPEVNTFVIDPHHNNPRAKRVYEKAGFKVVGQYTSEAGYFREQQSFLMVCKVGI